jgi:hypothetical protein
MTSYREKGCFFWFQISSLRFQIGSFDRIQGAVHFHVARVKAEFMAKGANFDLLLAPNNLKPGI